MDLKFPKIFKSVKRKMGFAGSPWQEPPQRDIGGYLSAYGEIYSLFGIALRIATAVGEVKWRLYKGSERSERSQVAKHVILDLLDYANEFQTGQEIIETTSLHMDLGGKAFWYLPRNGFGVPAEIWVLPPHKVKIVPSKEKFIAGFTYTIGNEKIPLAVNEIIWFPMPDPMNPYGGIGYAQAAAIELDSEMYAGQWNRNFFYNSARADAVLEVDTHLKEEQFESLKEQWHARHGGLSRAHKIAILENGVKYKQIQVSQKDMDFRELRRQTRENLLFAFGMPLSVMGISENVNRANAEAGDYTFARWLIKPRLTRIKNKLNEKLLSMYPQAKGVEIDFDEVVPETVEMKKGLAESGVKAGWMTINEARKLNSFDPVKTGDIFLIPFNMMPTPADKPIEAPKPPPEQPPKAKGLSNEQKETFWKVFARKAEAYERAMIKALRVLFEGQEKEALHNLHDGKTELINLSEGKKKFKDSVKPILLSQLQEAIGDGGELLNPKPAHRSKQDEPVSPEALEWLDTRIGWAAAEVGEETARLLSVQLRQGFEAGESIPKIADRVRGVFDYCSEARSLRIARTETIMASNEGALWGYAESGVVQRSEFFPAPDACEECESLIGEYPLEEAHGMIPVHPSCRCVWLPVI